MSILDKLYKIAFIIILTIGVFLRCYWYMIGRSLWEDEAHIALNFIHFNYLDLLKPLENFQTAPILFLWSVETFSNLFGNTELSLRAFPFIITIISLPVFYFLVKDLTKDKLCAIIAYLIFAVNCSFINFSSEIKSYTIDVSAYILITYVAIGTNEYVVMHRTKLLLLMGAIFIFYSSAAAVLLTCVSFYMLCNWGYTKNKETKSFSITLPIKDVYIYLCWIVLYLLYYFKFVYEHPYAEGMKNIWSWTFCPNDIFSSEFVDFINYRINDTIFSGMLFFERELFFNYLLLCIAIVALITIVKSKNYKVLIFTILPVCIHLILSMYKLYPFYFRFILYLMPPLIIFVSLGISQIVSFLATKFHVSVSIPILVFFTFCCTAHSIKMFPTIDREIKPVLNFINDNYPTTPIIITTPWTLYNYYVSTGYVKNASGKQIDWNLKAADYYNNPIIKSQLSSYILLYSQDGVADGYLEVLNDLEKKGLVINKFEFKTYGAAEIKALY